MLSRANTQVVLTLFAAVTATAWAVHLEPHPWLPFCLLVCAVLCSSGLTLEAPDRDGSISANFVFIFIGLVLVSPFQALLLAALSVPAQRRGTLRRRFSGIEIWFRIANAMLATVSAYGTFWALHRWHMAQPAALVLTSLEYFLWSTVNEACLLASTRHDSPYRLWRAEFLWYAPIYLVGAIIASLATWMGARFGWPTALLLLPATYTLYRAYTAQVAQLKDRQSHVEDTEALHLRTIEALAMAIEAKDQNTHDHLFRVRDYVEAVGSAMGLDKLGLQALETAAFLHDIGKLAVPEHIINKPGKLTPEEFEKMKIHPIVGADILHRVRFPYPVVPIVRSHHEWWNGTGYPDGLAGEKIPIGARVLTVVDCYDALVSDRPYRKGLSPEQGLEMIKSLSGKQFDPAVVDAFEQCHVEARLSSHAAAETAFSPLNTDVEVWRGLAPGAGFEAGSDENAAAKSSLREDDRPGGRSRLDSLTLIAGASQEAQALFEMSQSLGNSLSPTETVSVMASRLHRLIPHDVCALYLKQGDTLHSRFVGGERANELVPCPIPLGEGISGWVAQSGKPIFNGNATTEPGCASGRERPSSLCAALSIPLFDLQQEVFGVLTLYAAEPVAFQRDHLRILQAMEAKLSLSLANALQYRQTETDAETDFLTGLPNARRLFLQLAAELETCTSTNSSLAVAVCDLNAFKDVNDRRGHLAGNRLLGLIAEEFRKICTGRASVARMGGDEFVFLLPGLNDGDCDYWRSAITESVARASRRAGGGIRVTGSIGLASFPEDAATAEELLALADRRMYLDKQYHYSADGSHLIERATETRPLVACAD